MGELNTIIILAMNHKKMGLQSSLKDKGVYDSVCKAFTHEKKYFLSEAEFLLNFFSQYQRTEVFITLPDENIISFVEVFCQFFGYIVETQ